VEGWQLRSNWRGGEIEKRLAELVSASTNKTKRYRNKFGMTKKKKVIASKYRVFAWQSKKTTPPREGNGIKSSPPVEGWQLRSNWRGGVKKKK